MAKKPSTIKAAPETQVIADEIPEVIDDVEAPVNDDLDVAPAEASDEGDQPELSLTPEPEKKEPEDPRLEAVKRYRAMRDADKEPEPVEAEAEAEDEVAEEENDDQAELALEQPVAAKPEPTPEPKKEPAAQPDPVMQLMLQNLQTLQEEIKALKAPKTEPEIQSQRVELDEPETETKAAVDKEKLADIVRRIQVGDEEEGAQALLELTELTRPQAPQPQVDVSSLVQQEIMAAQIRRENDQAIQKFTQEFPEIAENSLRVAAMLRATTEEMINDLKSTGYTDQQLAEISNNTDKLSSVHQQARLRGAKFRDPSALLTDVGNRVMKDLNIVRPEATKVEESKVASKPQVQPKPQTTLDPAQAQARIARKQAAQVQPKPAGARTPVAQAPKPKTAYDIVMEMRKERKFSALH